MQSKLHMSKLQRLKYIYRYQHQPGPVQRKPASNIHSMTTRFALLFDFYFVRLATTLSLGLGFWNVVLVFGYNFTFALQSVVFHGAYTAAREASLFSRIALSISTHDLHLVICFLHQRNTLSLCHRSPLAESPRVFLKVLLLVETGSFEWTFY